MNTFKSRLKSVLMTGPLLLMSPAALAGSPGELEDRIAALEAMLSELKSDLAEQQAETDDKLERIESQAAVPAPKAANGSADVQWGGFIDLDVHVTDLSDGEIAGNSIARDFYIPAATPVGGAGESVSTDFTAKSSRFYVTANKVVDGHKVGGRIEMDFLGSAQGNEAVSNSYSPRLRRAYVTFDNWLFGQEWSTFQNTSMIPESASFLILPDGMVFDRQAQIRYTKGNFQFALENPNTNAGGLADDNLFPDVIARYNFKGDFGNVSVSGIARQLRVENGAVDEETFGYGLSVAGRLNVGSGGDDIRFSLTSGEGVGRYMGLSAVGSGIIDADGELQAIPTFGGLVAYRHVFDDKSRINIGYSGLFADNDDAAAPTATKSSQSAYVAYLWDIAPKVTVGAELMHAIREIESGVEGEMTRFTFSTKYAF